MSGETLTLYQLGYDAETPMSMAPHVWKALLPLRMFNVKFKRELVTLTQLREELPEKFGLEKVTVPLLVIRSEDGKTSTIMGSDRIALYLEGQYSTPTLSLFSLAGNGSLEDVAAGRAHARFTEEWVDKDLAYEIRPCVLHTGYSTFPVDGPQYDPRSRAQFLSKCGQEKMDELAALNADPEWKEEQYAKARKQLGILNTVLQERSESGVEGLFVAGRKPTHSDFVIFAFYPYSLTNPDLVRNTWRHPSLPHVGKWVDAMFATGLVEKGEVLPEPDLSLG